MKSNKITHFRHQISAAKYGDKHFWHTRIKRLKQNYSHVNFACTAQLAEIPKNAKNVPDIFKNLARRISAQTLFGIYTIKLIVVTALLKSDNSRWMSIINDWNTKEYISGSGCKNSTWYHAQSTSGSSDVISQVQQIINSLPNIFIRFNQQA